MRLRHVVLAVLALALAATTATTASAATDNPFTVAPVTTHP